MDDLVAQRQDQLEWALARMGGTHTVDDILTAIAAGRMQSFVSGSSWAVTQILELPRKRVLDVFLMVGEMPDVADLSGQIEAFAKGEGVQLLRALGRPGWLPISSTLGWEERCRLFVKEIS